mmetsp:Transcript_41865/g.132003  ORF Transcript_41865/g.132003 Transcript_41865/m.132003 type:complete len:778 (-) Transcript_41865:51-2384(-)
MAGVLGLIKGAYSSLPEINGATLSGAIDILVIEQEDGSLRSSPWHLRIGKYKLLRNPRDRAIKITVNDQLVDFVMKLGSGGEAYFVEETDVKPLEEEMTSPILSPRSDEDDKPPDLALGPSKLSETEESTSGYTSPSPTLRALDDKDELPAMSSADPSKMVSSSSSSWWGAPWSSNKPQVDSFDMDVEDYISRQLTENALSLQGGAAEMNMEDVKKLILGEETKHAMQARRVLSEEDFADQDMSAVTGQIIESEDLEYQQPLEPFHSLSQTELDDNEKTELDDNEDETMSDPYANPVEGAAESEENQKEDLVVEAVEADANKFALKKEEEYEEDDFNDSKMESEPVTREVLLKLLLSGLNHSDSTARTDEMDQSVEELQGLSLRQFKISLCGRILQQRADMSRKAQMEAFEKHVVTLDQFLANPLDIASSPELYVSVDGDIYRWQIMAPAVLSALAFNRELPSEIHQQLVALDSRFSMFHHERKNDEKGIEDIDDNPHMLLRLSSDDDSDIRAQMGVARKYSKKTLTPTQEQLLSLPLRDGPNTVRFYLSEKASVPPVTASIFLWTYKSKIVISDVDGTITKSDLLGHIAPAFGIQWAQKGVAQLLTRIHQNSYKILYLTARPIGQADATKSYLQSVHENGVRLPIGPVITSPDGMIKAVHREVIMRKPEEFKIECLSTLRKLFPLDSLPFYAGFGNRPTDVVSYQAVKIPDSRIMIINPQGEVHIPINQTRISSYDGLRELCDLMFPPVVEEREVTDEQFNAYNYWKLEPFPAISA